VKGDTDDRFELLHARAIGWPGDRFDYIGIDDDGDTTEHYAGEVRLCYLLPYFHSLSILVNRLGKRNQN
jgi:hypothetical protein